MAALSDFINDATPREREQLDAALRSSEQLRWAVRPRPRLLDCIRWDIWLFGLVWLTLVFIWFLGIAGLLTIDQRPAQAEDYAVGSLFMLIGLGFVSTPWVTQRMMRRSLYVLTQRRAIIIEPGLRRWRHYFWALNDRLLLMRKVQADGSGNLIFSREFYASANFSRRGFLGLPSVEEAERRIRDIIRERKGSREVSTPAGEVEDFVTDLQPVEREELARALFAEEKGHIIWAARSLSGLVLGSWRDLTHVWTGDHHLRPQLYIVTTRRALLLQPQPGGRWKQRAYPTHRNMVLKSRERTQGRGDLIFEIDVKKNSETYRGFMNLPDMEAARKALDTAVSCHSAA